MIIGLLLAGSVARADDALQISSITALSDNALALPISELATRFTHGSTISVAAVFGASADQTKKIEDGEPADLFITSDPEMIRRLKIKGMIDVYSVREIATKGDLHYTAAVVAGENMDSARIFLDYLSSKDAEAIFEQNGFSAPKTRDKHL